MVKKLRELGRLIEKHSSGDGMHHTPIPSLHLVKFSEPGAGMPTVYKPCLCVVVQGSKVVTLEDQVCPYSASDFMVISVDLPVMGRVTEASAEKPYYCLQLDIQARELSELVAQLDGSVPPPRKSSSCTSSKTGAAAPKRAVSIPSRTSRSACAATLKRHSAGILLDPPPTPP